MYRVEVRQDRFPGRPEASLVLRPVETAEVRGKHLLVSRLRQERPHQGRVVRRQLDGPLHERAPARDRRPGRGRAHPRGQPGLPQATPGAQKVLPERPHVRAPERPLERRAILHVPVEVGRVVAHEKVHQDEVGREARRPEVDEDAVLGRPRPHQTHVEEIQVPPVAGRAKGDLGEGHHPLGIRDGRERERVAHHEDPEPARRLRLDELLIVEPERVAPVVVPRLVRRDVRRLRRDELLQRGEGHGGSCRAARGEEPHPGIEGGGDAQHSLREAERGQDPERDEAEPRRHRQRPAP